MKSAKFFPIPYSNFTESRWWESWTRYSDLWVISPFPPKSHETVKTVGATREQGITGEKWSGFLKKRFFTKPVSDFSDRWICFPEQTTQKLEVSQIMNVRNEIKAQIIRTGMTMQQVVELLSDEYGWSDSVSNLSAKLQRESICMASRGLGITPLPIS